MMRPSSTQLMFAVAYSMCLAGCSTPVQMVPQATRCDVSPDLMQTRCSQPGLLADGATFSDLIDVMRNDRKALVDCGRVKNEISQELERCNRAIDDFNRRIEAVNAKSAAK